MQSLRHLVLRHRGLAAAVVALALLIKILVPAGYMVAVEGGIAGITFCTGMGPQPATMQDMAGHHGDTPQGKAETPCAFTGLALHTLAAADPYLLAVNIDFVIALAFGAVVAPVFAAPAFLRPPSQGPPITL